MKTVPEFCQKCTHCEECQSDEWGGFARRGQQVGCARFHPKIAAEPDVIAMEAAVDQHKGEVGALRAAWRESLLLGFELKACGVQDPTHDAELARLTHQLTEAHAAVKAVEDALATAHLTSARLACWRQLVEAKPTNAADDPSILLRNYRWALQEWHDAVAAVSQGELMVLGRATRAWEEVRDRAGRLVERFPELGAAGDDQLLDLPLDIAKAQ